MGICAIFPPSSSKTLELGSSQRLCCNGAASSTLLRSQKTSLQPRVFSPLGVHSSHPRQLLHGLRVRGAQQDGEAIHQVQQSEQHGGGVREGGQHLEGGCPRRCGEHPGGQGRWKAELRGSSSLWLSHRAFEARILVCLWRNILVPFVEGKLRLLR